MACFYWKYFPNNIISFCLFIPRGIFLGGSHFPLYCLVRRKPNYFNKWAFGKPTKLFKKHYLNMHARTHAFWKNYDINHVIFST